MYPIFLASISIALGTGVLPEEVISGALWRLGMVRTGVQSRETFLAIRVHRQIQPALAEHFKTRPRQLLFLLTAMGAREWTAAVPEHRWCSAIF